MVAFPMLRSGGQGRDVKERSCSMDDGKQRKTGWREALAGGAFESDVFNP